MLDLEKLKAKFEDFFNTTTEEQFAEIVRRNKESELSSDISKIEEEAAALWFVEPGNERAEIPYMDGIAMARAAHISVAKMYSARIKELEADVEHWKDQFESLAKSEGLL